MTGRWPHFVINMFIEFNQMDWWLATMVEPSKKRGELTIRPFFFIFTSTMNCKGGKDLAMTQKTFGIVLTALGFKSLNVEGKNNESSRIM